MRSTPAVRHLEQNPPDIVVVVDADCMLRPDALDILAHRCAVSARPVQALYLMRLAQPALASRRGSRNSLGPSRTAAARSAWRALACRAN
ncbi:hypothetical protein LP419_06395 [Massilia sp. H-1]|nr:hypothetical protein LP419_06395 [Massilia sp. H-1]